MMNRNGFLMFNILYEKKDGYCTALERAQVKGEKMFFCGGFLRGVWMGLRSTQIDEEK